MCDCWTSLCDSHCPLFLPGPPPPPPPPPPPSPSPCCQALLTSPSMLRRQKQKVPGEDVSEHVPNPVAEPRALVSTAAVPPSQTSKTGAMPPSQTSQPPGLQNLTGLTGSLMWVGGGLTGLTGSLMWVEGWLTGLTGSLIWVGGGLTGLTGSLMWVGGGLWVVECVGGGLWAVVLTVGCWLMGSWQLSSMMTVLPSPSAGPNITHHDPTALTLCWTKYYSSLYSIAMAGTWHPRCTSLSSTMRRCGQAGVCV